MRRNWQRAARERSARSHGWCGRQACLSVVANALRAPISFDLRWTADLNPQAMPPHHPAPPRPAPQCNAVQRSAVQCSAAQCSAVQRSAVQCNAMQCNAMQCNAMQCDALPLSVAPLAAGAPSVRPTSRRRILTSRRKASRMHSTRAMPTGEQAGRNRAGGGRMAGFAFGCAQGAVPVQHTDVRSMRSAVYRRGAGADLPCVRFTQTRLTPRRGAHCRARGMAWHSISQPA
jgi:hypothetical protein